MRPEIEQSLRKAELGNYLVEAAKADASIDEALEKGFQEGVIRERERRLAIDRVGGKEALQAAECLASAMRTVREGR
jgi:hypothetical protein